MKFHRSIKSSLSGGVESVPDFCRTRSHRRITQSAERRVPKNSSSDIESQPIEDVRINGASLGYDWIRRSYGRSFGSKIGVSVSLQGKCNGNVKAWLFGGTE